MCTAGRPALLCSAPRMPNPDRPSRPDRAPRLDRAPRSVANDRPVRNDRPARDDRGPRTESRQPPRDQPSRDQPRPVRDDRGPRTESRQPPRDQPRRDEPRRDEPRRDEPRPARDQPHPEIKICGVNACHAVAAQRPDDVRRVYINSANLQDFGPFLKRCAGARIAYHVVEDAELEKITQSVHHEGVCFIVREKAPTSLRQLLAVQGPRVLVYLDGVQNPHNLGAIVRVCAHFGAVGVLAAGARRGPPRRRCCAPPRAAASGSRSCRCRPARSRCRPPAPPATA
jgi:TrmH RNA methyltransferase